LSAVESEPGMGTTVCADACSALELAGVFIPIGRLS